MMLRKIQIAVAVFLFSVFFIFSILILKPLASAFIGGIFLAAMFYPVYKFLLRYMKSKSITAFFICIVLLLILGVGLWYSTKAVAEQAISFYKEMRKADIPEKIAKFVTKALLAKTNDTELSDAIESKIRSGLKSFSNTLSSAAESFVSNIYIYLLNLFVVFFVMFYFLRDGDKFYKGIYEVLPFDEKTKKIFVKRSEEVTKGVILGRIILGILQGIVCVIGFWIFGVEQLILFGVLAMFLSMIPFIGPWFVWIPVGINLFFIAGIKVGIMHLLYQLIITSNIDNLLGPVVMGKTTKMHDLSVFLGMIGGALAFGIVGFFVGPIIIEYVLIFLEIFKEKVEMMRTEREKTEEKKKEKLKKT